jgi:hypothetical protein
MQGLQLGAGLAAVDRPWLAALAHELQDFLEAAGHEQFGQAPAASRVRFSYSDTARQLIARAQQLADEGPPHD